MPHQIDPRVSLCMIVKNEEHNLQPCLAPVASLFDEIILVDTGSSDCTRQVGRELGAVVIDEPWRDDFSAARNRSLACARGDWIFWLDGDDRLDPENVERLGLLLAQLGTEQAAYVMKCVCLPIHASDSRHVVSHARLFRRNPGTQWVRRVHERLDFGDEQEAFELRYCDIEITHVGYRDATLNRRKHNRNLRLLRLEYAIKPNDPETLFYLGAEHAAAGEYAPAYNYLSLCLDQMDQRTGLGRKLYALLVECLSKLQRKDGAISIALQGLVNFPDDPELLYKLANIQAEMGDLVGTEASLMRLLTSKPEEYMRIGVESGLNTVKPRYMLALLRCDQRRYREAQGLLQELLAEQPDFAQAWVALGQVYLAQRHLAQVERVVRQLQKCPSGEVYGPVLKAELHMARNEFYLARALLDQAIAMAPQLMWARLALSDLLLREGQDVQACILAQHDILQLDPGNAIAHQNLVALNKIAEQTPAAMAKLCTSELVGM